MHNPFRSPSRNAARLLDEAQVPAARWADVGTGRALDAFQAAAEAAADLARSSRAGLSDVAAKLDTRDIAKRLDTRGLAARFGLRAGAAAMGTGLVARATRLAAPVVAPLAAPFAKPAAGRFLRNAAIDDLLAAGLSALVLAWRGRRETGSAVAPINAPSHWFFGDEALRRNSLSWRYTGTGMLTHFGSALLWALTYRAVRVGRRTPTPVNALTDAAAVTAVAAFVDLKAVPDRLTPGFQKRLSDGSLVLVYGGFALGLAIGGWLALRGRR